jgi:capsular exopolysaccharide synthesis family protein
MGRIYEALQRARAEKPEPDFPVSKPGVSSGVVDKADSDTIDLSHVRSMTIKAGPEDRLVALGPERTAGAERIRILAARLRGIQDQRKIKRLLITSTVKEEGKTVLSTNIAISLAKGGQRVLLMDGDCHQGNVERLLGAEGAQGLADWWRAHGALPLQEYMTGIRGLPLWLLPSGGNMEQPIEMLQSERLAELISQLSNLFEWVVIDSPPLAPLADGSVWAKVVDAILLVARDRKTPKRLLRRVPDALDPSKLLGIVLNDCVDPDQQYYDGYYQNAQP